MNTKPFHERSKDERREQVRPIFEKLAELKFLIPILAGRGDALISRAHERLCRDLSGPDSDAGCLRR